MHNLKKIQSVKGMYDILPDSAYLWEYLELHIKKLVKIYGYSYINTPILEKTELFQRSIGEETDILEKEMYSFQDRYNGEELTLRPEGTVSVSRAILEHHLLYNGPKRLWYIGPMFRRERPQRGRYRQFHQFGVEAVGFIGPEIEAEIILMGQRLWKILRLNNINLEINCLGCISERSSYQVELVKYFEKYKNKLNQEKKRRLYINPLRILDSKDPVLKEIIENAPKLINFLGKKSIDHFNEIQDLLLSNNIPYKINNHLVRGLDYYNHTVFEWTVYSEKFQVKTTIAGGGRYDSLIEQIGGKYTPSCGWAMGIERILLVLHEQEILCKQKEEANTVTVYVLHQGYEAFKKAMIYAEILRSSDVNTILHCSTKQSINSLKSQIKKANSFGATFALIIGQREFKENTLQLKNLKTGEQITTTSEKLLSIIQIHK